MMINQVSGAWARRDYCVIIPAVFIYFENFFIIFSERMCQFLEFFEINGSFIGAMFLGW